MTVKRLLPKNNKTTIATNARLQTTIFITTPTDETLENVCSSVGQTPCCAMGLTYTTVGVDHRAVIHGLDFIN